MTSQDPQKYRLTIRSNFSYLLEQNGKKVKFSYPASKNKTPKLYTLSRGKELLYVGITSQAMSGRLNSGLKAAGKGGYHGYKWKNLRDPITLKVWTVTENSEYITVHDIETIEAEVAYTCRHLSGKWPSHQNEIHFHASNNEHTKVAEAIYSKITED